MRVAGLLSLAAALVALALPEKRAAGMAQVVGENSIGFTINGRMKGF
jgi:hypothetical protein